MGSKTLKRFEKMAGDMPPFLKQDRPEKVKEIYRALKRDHPDMPAAMKARIAARQGKRGKQKQGPPYKGPLTKEGSGGLATGLGTAGIAHMFKGSMAPAARRAIKAKDLVVPAIGLGAAATGISIAHKQNKERLRKALEAENAKTAALSDALDVLWGVYGRTEEMEKGAATSYFFDLQKPSLDREALGTEFCKLASTFGKDPWILASEVEQRLPAFDHLSKVASNEKVRDLAQFYVTWAGDLEKQAFIRRLAKGVAGMFRRGKSVAKAAPRPVASPESQMMSWASKQGTTAQKAMTPEARMMSGAAKPKSLGGNVSSAPTKPPMTQSGSAAAKKKPLFTPGQKLVGGVALSAGPTTYAAYKSGQQPQQYYR